MTDDVSKIASEARILSEVLSEMLASKSPIVQGAVLGELLSIWIAGFEPAAREDTLNKHVDFVRKLIPAHAEVIDPFREEADRAWQRA